MSLLCKRNSKRQRLLSEAELRSHRCAFTGHRPEKITGLEGKIIVELRKEILKAIDDGYTTFITGMSRGVDLWAADIVIHLRRNNRSLKLIGVIPFEGFETGWTVDWKKHYSLVRKELDWIHVIAPQYQKDAYQVRNEFMVDHSSRILAVYNGVPGGTQNTILYAQSKKVPVITLEV